ncbi:Rieske 2Fe-2S domain-containing protein [Tsukamurella pseudospumae]|uniref:(2Fe-2S)-binding protein n=1 Tax=Tsukamurella pseudospumae TaxID=239498 RepID=A0A138A125_9ACTN|nr:Rieske 2Fe-2S domain-containing protein [Tsukamurella pseudospumae]KXO98363.1 (2Fe-2S)-binding protein [Tsukamurella pseudospumae]KXP04132.1 (2Fe-2S)-binding protein [Tsukamurella pseudospumae]
MQVTSVGHAGFHISTAAGTILCDPWVNPAYFGSWFPFPDNTQLDWKTLGDVDYLYVSHLHRDHFDAKNLAENVSKDATVLLPDYPVPDLRRELEKLGFTKFFETQDSVKHTISGPKGDLDVMIIALRAPADGPIGDSGLVVSDGETVLFNMNDARPVDMEVLDEFGGIDVHLLQYSGAIWYPMVYDMPKGSKRRFAEQKRQRGMDRARSYVDQVAGTWVVPSAGPPAFLDPELRYLNDEGRVDRESIGGDPSNIFPDQITFLEQMKSNGNDGGLLFIPGTVGEFRGKELVALTHPVSEAEVMDIFENKTAYLDAFAARQAPVLEAEKATWAPDDGVPLLGALKAKFEPIMQASALISDGIGYAVGLEMASPDGAVETVVLDFPTRTVRAPQEGDGKYRYGFRIAAELVRTVLRDDEPDWVNTIFLSTRFTTWRIGGYNEFLYTFFKCLTDERIAYADGWFSEAHDDTASTELDGWEVQRRCPHLKADLSTFGVVDGGKLTCNLHGWQWDLESGRCLTSSGHEIRAKKLT